MSLYVTNVRHNNVTIMDTADNTKRLLFSATGNATGITTTIASTSTGSNQTISLPNASDTLVARSTTDTLSNKSLTAGNCFVVDGTDATKRIAFSSTGNSTSVTTTLASTSTTSQTVNLPNVTTTDTLVGQATTATLTNKNLSASTCPVVDATDATKRILFSTAGNTTATTLTLSSAQSTAQTLSIPNITAGDTITTLGLAQTFTGVKTFSANPVISAISNTGLLTLPTTSGTVALISDIPSSANFVDVSTNQTIAGQKTFSIISYTPTPVTSTSTLTTSNTTFVPLNSSSAITVTLPTTTGNNGLQYFLVNVNTGTVTVQVNASPSNTNFDGNSAITSVTLIANDRMKIICYNNIWYTM